MDKHEMSTQILELSEHKTYIELSRRSCYYNYPNGNGVQLNYDDNAQEMAETLINQPVVAKYKVIAGKDDLGGHECTLTPSGEVKFNTANIGVNTAIEIKEDEVSLYSGETVTTPCLFVTSRIWKRNKQVCSAIKRLFNTGQLHSSWEILTEKTETANGVKVLKDYVFESDCLLGSKTSPAFGECATTLCMASLEENPEMLIAEALANDIYNTEAKEDIMAKTQEVAEEEVIETTPVEENAEVTENAETTPTAEVSEEENSEDKPNEEVSEEISEEVIEQSSLTVCDIRKKIGESVRKSYRDAWVEFLFPAENYVLVRDYMADLNELEYLKIPYTVNGDEVSIGDAEKVKLVVSVAEINATIAEKDEAIVKANEEIQALKKENEELEAYKKRCKAEDEEKEKAELAEKQDALKKFALDSKQITSAELETEEFKTIISELDEAKIKSIIADRVVASITKNATVETSEIDHVEEMPKANINEGKYDVDYRSAINSFLGK